MKPLSRFQLWTVGVLLSIGTAMVITSLIAVIFVSVGYTLITMALVWMILECGPLFWYWWIPFRFGYEVKIEQSTYSSHFLNIRAWLEENIKNRVKYLNGNGGTYYFLFKSDATGFKLRWSGKQ